MTNFLEFSPSISLFISLLAQRFFAFPSCLDLFVSPLGPLSLTKMQLTSVQILYNYAFEPFEKAMHYFSISNRSFATSGSSYRRFHTKFTSGCTSKKRSALCTVMSPGFAGRTLSGSMHCPREHRMSLLAL